MRTIGIKPLDAVLLIQRVDGQEFLYNALVGHVGMDPVLLGERGEPGISAFTLRRFGVALLPVMASEVRHISNREWSSMRNGWAYEELPPRPGVCRYCGCTERRACTDGLVQGCSWIDAERTVCSAFGCMEKLTEDAEAMAGFRPAEGRPI